MPKHVLYLEHGTNPFNVGWLFICLKSRMCFPGWHSASCRVQPTLLFSHPSPVDKVTLCPSLSYQYVLGLPLHGVEMQDPYLSGSFPHAAFHVVLLGQHIFMLQRPQSHWSAANADIPKRPSEGCRRNWLNPLGSAGWCFVCSDSVVLPCDCNKSFPAGTLYVWRGCVAGAHVSCVPYRTPPSSS